MNISIPELISVIRDAGALGLLIVILYGGAKRWWVWGWQYTDLQKQSNMWRDLALENLALAKRSAHLSETLVKSGNPDEDSDTTT